MVSTRSPCNFVDKFYCKGVTMTKQVCMAHVVGSLVRFYCPFASEGRGLQASCIQSGDDRTISQSSGRHMDRRLGFS